MSSGAERSRRISRTCTAPIPWRSTSSPSIFDPIMEFFEGLFGMDQERAS